MTASLQAYATKTFDMTKEAGVKGRIAHLVRGTLAGGAVGGTYNGIDAYMNDENMRNAIQRGVVTGAKVGAVGGLVLGHGGASVERYARELLNNPVKAKAMIEKAQKAKGAQHPWFKI